jgi:tripartite-type tricarboxylate transporter receptor subunit TctC
MNSWLKILLAGLALTQALTTTVTTADEAAGTDFYRGKKIQIIVGFDIGGGYDAYARLIGRHMGRHISGDPSFIVQNMPGAGSRVAANHLYNLVPKDGTVLGSIVQSTPVDQILGEPGIRYDATKFAWIGNPIIDNLVTVVATSTGLSTLTDIRAKGGLVCGSSGAGPTLIYPRIMAKLLPADIRVVPGYPGVTAINVAIERDEVNCIGGTGWSSMKATMSQMMHDGKLKVLLQWGAGRDPEIDAFAGAEVPMMDVLATTTADRDAVLIVSATTALSRPILGPPGMPTERIEMLRRAFNATMKDTQFLEDAKRLRMDINPISGAAIQEIVERVVRSSPEGIARAKELSN